MPTAPRYALPGALVHSDSLLQSPARLNPMSRGDQPGIVEIGYM